MQSATRCLAIATLAGDFVQSQSIAPVGSSHSEKNFGAAQRKIIRVIRKAYTGEKETVFNSKAG